jgi:biopolymer transport protein ExbB
VATGRTGARENAELAASEEAAKWFRRIEMLNVIGHLGPLLGLVGTVYGMIIAFAALGETGGRAGPGELSLGISKALFHTFLGLMLAIPSLLAYGYFRTVIDRVCTRAMVAAGQIVEALPDEALDTAQRSA